jgi:hypothetical protein
MNAASAVRDIVICLRKVVVIFSVQKTSSVELNMSSETGHDCIHVVSALCNGALLDIAQ